MALQLFTALLGSLGFSIKFHMQGVKLLFAALGGLFSWGIYLLAHYLSDSLFTASMLSSCFAAAYAEILARILRTPATLFIVPSIIPIVPGGSLYYAMYNAVMGNTNALSRYGFETVSVALGLAVGLAVVTSICNILYLLHRRRLIARLGLHRPSEPPSPPKSSNLK